ncbi:class I SAM-dependent methyltransferase [Methylobacterium gnaphalii]|nr:2-methoxy-6-polyprenyl-1,4-benzoquinol methylase, mitochondrial [Methylobacterium gnaphalii]GLS50714.1 methyltransferase type 11 [Methylobacterium gnaphalii]
MIRRPLCILALTAAFANGAVAQDVQPMAPPGIAADRFPKPDRPVAEIVSPAWALEKRRNQADEVGQVATLMGIREGQTVADVGAGNGYYVFRLAKRVGPTGRVLAEDITPDYLVDLDKRVRESGQSNITVVRGDAHDPRLPPASLDVAVLVHMYHEISQPYGLLHNLATAMKPGGWVGIVDADDIPSKHGTPPKLLRCELAAAGYREVSMKTLKGGVGYLAIFEPPSPEARPDPATITPCKDETTRKKAR